MGTISKVLFSSSSSGKPILISATNSGGTTIHTTTTSATTIDEVWLYASNNSLSTVSLVIEYGATGSTNEIYTGIPSRSGLSIILPGLLLTGDGATSSNIRAYASTTDKINIVGYINRIVP